MRALVVGAGVVGQVYCRHLARGGADVAFLVKPEHLEECRAGLTVYSLNRPRRRRGDPERFSAYDVYASVDEVAGEQWDQVYLAMSSTALRARSWFASLVPAVGGATIVLLQPGPEDREFVLRKVPEDQVVQGEAIEVVARRRAQRPPAALRLAARPVVVRALLRLAPLVTPFDLETYLRIHFTKVGDQTQDFLRTDMAWGESVGVPTDALARVSGSDGNGPPSSS